MLEEYNALQRNRTWSLVELPPDKKTIDSRWVFKVKKNPDGSISKYKARLVAKAENSLFLIFSATSTIYLLVHVDDIIVVGSQKLELDNFISVLNKLFSLKDLGELNYFLGIEVWSTDKGLHLSQKKYICDLLKRSKMDQANPLPTPMVSSLKLITTDGDPIPNILSIGALLELFSTSPSPDLRLPIV
ncbi:hypothetical protein UlMin_019634 [Ulmus minor]